LFRLATGPLADPVDHVFLDQDADLFGEVGTGRQFRHTLANDRSFGQITQPVADQIPIRRVPVLFVSSVPRSGSSP
jgi:hypothetical protein